MIEELSIHFTKRAYERILDLYRRYNKQMLAKCLQDLTIFQNFFRVLRLVILLIGWTNLVSIFHENVTYILKEEILKYTLPYIDDVLVRGLAT